MNEDDGRKTALHQSVLGVGLTVCVNLCLLVPLQASLAVVSNFTVLSSFMQNGKPTGACVMNEYIYFNLVALKN